MSMRCACIAISGRSRPLCHTVWLAERAHQRLRGLLFRPPLVPGQGLWLHGVRSVHMFGMRVAIDVVFLDRACTVTGVRAWLPPNRTCMGEPGSHHTLELAAGMIQAHGLVRGMVLDLRAA